MNITILFALFTGELLIDVHNKTNWSDVMQNLLYKAANAGAARCVATLRIFIARISLWLPQLCMILFAGSCWSAYPMNLPKKPNIIILLADDMGWGDIAANNPESKLPLPNLERLAARGMRFTDAHSTGAHCMPSRYSLLSGNYTWRGKQEYGIALYQIGSQFLQGQWSIGDALRQAGYATAFVGKSHLGGYVYKKNSNDYALWTEPEDQYDFARGIVDGSTTHGFDYSFLSLAGHAASPFAFFEDDYLVGDPADLFIWQQGTYGSSVIPVAGIGMPYWDSTALGSAFLGKAIDFIRANVQAGASGNRTPFFLYYALTEPHRPWTPPVDLNGKPVKGVSGIGNRSDILIETDVIVGELVAELERLGVMQDTIIIFTSDNGPDTDTLEQNAGHDSSGGLRDNKGSIYEGGHRVPLIVRWGNGSASGSFISPGTIAVETVGLHDLFATLAALTGVTLPAEQAKDSWNLLPILFDDESRNIAGRDHLLYVSKEDLSGNNLPQGLRYSYALREGPWKLIVETNNNPPTTTPLALYDLDNDLAEATDLIDEPGLSSTVSSMLARFDTLRASSRTVPQLVLDLDSDGVLDGSDNCATVDNPDQLDSDGDMHGDVCDAFPSDAGEFLDTDKDGIGDNADIDDDGDSLPDAQEILIGTSLLLSDTDGDGFYDAEELASSTNPLSSASFPAPNGDLAPYGLPDGVIDAGDVLVALRILAGRLMPTTTDLARGDMNSDGLLNLADVIVILRQAIN